MNLLNVVDQRVQLPLRVDFQLASERESAQAFVLEIGKHRLDDRDALVLDEAAPQRVELALHLLNRLLPRRGGAAFLLAAAHFVPIRRLEGRIALAIAAIDNVRTMPCACV